MQKTSSLADFHPLLRQWFHDRYREPTLVQETSWPTIREGKHVLISAPTGCGKTLTAFLSALDDFIQGDLVTGTTRVLYISPLKALNNDIRENLLQPLSELEELFQKEGEKFPEVRVQVRSGDTSSSERQRMLRKPPEILITTPESFSLLLTTKKGRESLSQVELVIADEIHAIVDNRRGAQLMVCLERLVELAGEFQRVALSATVNPIETVANYVAGFISPGRSRSIEILDVSQPKQLEIDIKFPPDAKKSLEQGGQIWPALFESLHNEMSDSRSTLFFSNSRKQAEKVTLGLNDHAQDLVAYAHHGSLAREIRVEVEQRLKNGELKAIVATNSLELGIDIGDLDKVVLIQSPQSLASATQKIGRAGHKVGDVSRCVVYPTHAQDFIDAAVIAKSVQAKDLEPLKPMVGPLDLLAQMIVSMVATEAWKIDDIYQVICRSTPYAHLERDQFDLIMQMLLGSFEDSRIRDLKPRLALESDGVHIHALKSATFALYSSGGTIPNRGYYQLKTNDGQKVGELDEEFVWEAKPGQSFSFGTQSWTITQITHNDVIVRPSKSDVMDLPFWKSEQYNRSSHFSERIGEFLSTANEWLRNDQEAELKDELATLGFDETAADQLIELLVQQRKVTHIDLPGTNHIVAEYVRSGPGGYRMPGVEGQLIIHTYWGAQVNRPIAYALEDHWEQMIGTSPDIFVDNRVICIQMKGTSDPTAVLALLNKVELPKDLYKTLESKPFFAGRFRECAGRALLLSKSSFNRRVPLWMTRMQAQKLQTAVMKYPDFPVLLETWRTCLEDEFDIGATQSCLDRLNSGACALSLVERDIPSPFAREITHSQVSPYMYGQDQSERPMRSNLSTELIQAAVINANLRPPVKLETIEEIELRLQRRIDEYVPKEERELVQWIRSRVWIPMQEWFSDLDVPDEAEILKHGDLVWVTHRDSKDLADRDPLLAVTRALRYYGPHTLDQFEVLIPPVLDDLREAFDALVEEGTLVDDVIVEGCDELAICDAENMHYVVRFQRRANRPIIEPIAPKHWASYLAKWQGIVRNPSEQNLVDAMERLLNYRAPIRFWLQDAWMSRFREVNKEHVFEVLESYGLKWMGSGKERIVVGLPEDLISDTPEAEYEDIVGLFRDKSGGYDFHQLMSNSTMKMDEFNEKFWGAVWAGRLTSTTLNTLKRAFDSQFKLAVPQRRRISRKRALSRTHTIGWPGVWTLAQTDESDPNSELELLERTKDKCRRLLERYGVVCREIANREGGEFSWGSLFTGFRLMELAEEVVAGVFISEFSGPQFAIREAVDSISHSDFHKGVFWVSAFDPISPTGLGIADPRLPTRRVGNHLGYANGELVIVSESFARTLSIYTEGANEHLVALLNQLPTIVSNRRIVIERINGIEVLKSDYLDLVTNTLPFRRDHKQIYLDNAIV